MSTHEERWKAEDAAKAALAGIAREIAKALGKPWKYEEQTEPYPTHYIANGAEARIALHVPWSQPDRIAIGGSLNVGKNGQYITLYKQGGEREYVPEITVAVSRGVPKIVEEIKRRLLPEYERILALAIDKRNKDAAYQNRTRENLKTLAKITRTDLGKYKDDERTSYSFYTGEYHGEVRVSDGDVTLHISSLNVEEAEKILRVIFPKK